MKRILAAIMALCLIFCSGCGGEKATAQSTPDTPADSTAQKSTETELGYVPTELAMPEDLSSIWGWDSYGDTIWLGGQSADGSLLILSYDTISEEFSRYALDTADARNPVPESFSVSADSVWVLLTESYTSADAIRTINLDDLGHYVFCMAPSSGESTCTRLPFSGESGSEGSGSFFSSILALDAGRTLLTTPSTSYVIDPAGNILSMPDLPELGNALQLRINNQRYIRIGSDYTALDETNLQLGDIMPNLNGRFSSNTGNVFCTEHGILYKVDSATGENSEVFKWMDVALSYRGMGGNVIFENSAGVFFYPARAKIIKVTQGQIPKKQALTLLCFGNSGSKLYQYQSTAYTYTPELMDAIIRFNNSDPEYKIEIKPAVFADEAERSRLLIELATADDVDLIDTSLLPEGAIKEGLLVDMLPYIDADEKISRDDFIEPLFNAMQKGGALYEYTDKFTLLSILARKDVFPGRAAWSVDNIRQIQAQRPDLDCLSRERLMDSFVLAASAEFIDSSTMTCAFDCAAFQNWLKFMKSQPASIDRYENTLIFQISPDLTRDVGMWARIMFETDYVVAGFPETAGSGSYFVKLDGAYDSNAKTLGSNTRLGIMASGKHPDGAWRFVRTLMLGESEDDISSGVPVIKARFEKALDRAVTDQAEALQNIDVFNEEDAKILREQVYNTTKLVSSDEDILTIIRSEATQYFEGQKSVEEAANQTQSRVGIYLAEQYG